MPTIPTENYLIAIQTLHDDEVRCIPARIAEVVGVSPPTVTEALKRLARDEYIEPSHDPQVQLTEKGRALVFELIRRHRIVERWLTDVLGLDWAAAHEEAHHLEHAMSEAVAERLWASMGCPSGCPHGNPIPPLGVIPEPDRTGVRLRDVPAGEQVTLARISELAEDNSDVMHFFHEKGFRPNKAIVVVDRAPLNGPLTVEVDGRAVALSEDLAAYIWVRPSEAPPVEGTEARELAAGRV